MFVTLGAVAINAKDGRTSCEPLFPKPIRKEDHALNQEHTLEELRARSRTVIGDPKLVEIARQSPSAAYKLTLAKTGSVRKAKAARFLAILLRDFGQKAFTETVTTNPAYARHAREHMKEER